MTDLAHPDFSHAGATATRRARPWTLRLAVGLYVGVAFAGAAGLAIGHLLGGHPDTFDRNLLVLLRFMAALKCLGALGAAALTHWRMMSPIAPRLAGAYVAAICAMAAGSGLIWSLGAIAAGAVLFHAGLLMVLGLARRDGAASWPSRRGGPHGT